ncbi:telomere repeats-binding bouquet formation protein 1 isoform X1 [Poecilia latipinna]|uniref:telomere repeats-binding bouquet formation protein 1 isoform X1 n=1 Tax=Poecilia latipinna TaxID=48699 RepID=UPI00072E31B3|nr:PREDICTED: telomere repeats-binding bouquet formation protein 1 isoform X1 [Poecilia latipinna]XP_014902543.1 PREDICTED: telomere repeats-binding bouquet formation protein 1 isoform X1 [Poecilia latipinna]
MDRAGSCRNNRNTTKTDLSLLLECVKFQMKCPDSQKQALLTIHSICEKREDNVDLLRELGGVSFLYNLSKSSNVHSDVKETALFTLGTLAEANVYCKNSLCRKDIFIDIAGHLQEDSPLNKKRVSVYLLFVLVAHNKLGQTLAQTTGCLEILMDLFRSTFPFSTVDNLRTVSQNYQLWTSVSSALCGSVNNPQNEEGQRICVAAFPIVKTWLQQISVPSTETFQPICSFIAMTVSNNSYVQESFAACGGLETLTLALLRVVSAAGTSLLSRQLSVVIVKTLSACITDNPHLAAGLAQYGLVYHLFFLLTSSHFDPDDRLSVLLAIGECTEASEEHQSQLVDCGGLPIMITFLTEDSSEDVRKAATFILQTCKKAMLSLGVHGLMEKQAENEEPPLNIEEFKNSAREIIRRIELLEKTQLKEIGEEQEDILCPNSVELQPFKPPPLRLPAQKLEANKTTSILRPIHKSSGDNSSLQLVKSMAEVKKVTSRLIPPGEETKRSGGDVMRSVKSGGRIGMSSDVWSSEGGSEPHMENNSLFSHPLSVWLTKPKGIRCCYESQGSNLNGMRKIPPEEHSVSNGRCAGCVLTFEEVTSRSFASVQSSCVNSCDMHRVLQEATERFRMHRFNFGVRREQKSVTKEHSDTNSARVSTTKLHRSCENMGAGIDTSSLQQHSWRKHNGVTLTPRYKTTRQGAFPSKRRIGPSLTPLKRPHPREANYQTSDSERRGRNSSEHYAIKDQSKISTDHSSSRRKRQDFSGEEVHHLLSGVRKYGYSWNFILWSYPFQPGRTNVDLAKKYRRLMRQQKS